MEILRSGMKRKKTSTDSVKTKQMPRISKREYGRDSISVASDLKMKRDDFVSRTLWKLQTFQGKAHFEKRRERAVRKSWWWFFFCFCTFLLCLLKCMCSWVTPESMCPSPQKGPTTKLPSSFESLPTVQVMSHGVDAWWSRSTKLFLCSLLDYYIWLI